MTAAAAALPLSDARLLTTALTRLFGQLDHRTLEDLVARVDYVRVARGDTVYRQGDPGTGMHVVITGRLQVRVSDGDGGENVVAYLYPGDCVGEMALFTGASRSASVIAVRDTTLGALTRDMFEAVIVKHPDAAINIARLIVARLTAAQSRGSARTTLRNIALVPADGAVDVEEFGRRLQLALLRLGTTAYLDAHTLHAMLGGERRASRPDGAASATEVGRALDAWEHTHDYVLYQADAEATEWTRTCLGYADKILLVAAADREAPPTAAASLVGDSRFRGLVERELVLVHQDAARIPSGTSAWLARLGVDRHHHLTWAGNAGFNRLARRLANQAVVVVLGGGRARGFAHIGAIRALREAGIPIDAAGGTSFGAIIAALVALGYSDERILEVSKSAFMDDRPMDDYTLPIVSLVKGEKLVWALRKYFGEVAIEDLWLPYFAVSSNLSRSRIVIHTEGPVWKAVRATVSLPGIFPSLLENGELLIDGGLLNNLPVDVMADLVPGRTIAVDLSVEQEYRIERDAMPSAYEYLRTKMLGHKGARLEVPTLNRVMIKATTLGSARLAGLVRTGADLYLNPPVRDFDLLAWDRFHDIVAVGYEYTKRKLDEWLPAHPDLVRPEEFFDSRRSRNLP